MIYISQQGINLIKSFEHLALEVYRDAAGFKTIGYGHKLTKNEFYEKISEEFAEFLLKNDLKTSEDAISRLIKVPLTQYQFDALVSFVFNCGAGTLQRSTLRSVINRKEYAKAPDQILKYDKINGTKSNGIFYRRTCEAKLFCNKM